MRFYFLSGLCLALSTGMAQGKCFTPSQEVVEIKSDLKDFKGISYGGFASVEYTPHEKTSITLTGPKNILEKYTKIEKKGHVLQIETEECFTGDPKIKIIITAPHVHHFALAGSGDFKSTQKIQEESCKFILSGSGDMNFNIDCKETNLQISGSGDITLAGKSTSGHFTINGSGQLQGKDLSLETAHIQMNGSGDIEASVSQKVNATVNGTGNIKIQGQPQVSQTINGSGSIKVSK